MWIKVFRIQTSRCSRYHLKCLYKGGILLSTIMFFSSHSIRILCTLLITTYTTVLVFSHFNPDNLTILPYLARPSSSQLFTTPRPITKMQMKTYFTVLALAATTIAAPTPLSSTSDVSGIETSVSKRAPEPIPESCTSVCRDAHPNHECSSSTVANTSFSL